MIHYEYRHSSKEEAEAFLEGVDIADAANIDPLGIRPTSDGQWLAVIVDYENTYETPPSWYDEDEDFSKQYVKQYPETELYTEWG